MGMKNFFHRILYWSEIYSEVTARFRHDDIDQSSNQ